MKRNIEQKQLNYQYQQSILLTWQYNSMKSLNLRNSAKQKKFNLRKNYSTNNLEK
ncbi:MAG: hypothetical protein KBC84_06190 [Proteobacteria bacterium]|nr:hypothetical protein [Pseudomonadota bacterium]